MLSDEELARIERRIRAAAPEPWFSYVVGRDMEAGSNCIELGSYQTIEVVGGSIADQDFIAHAREDLPRLLEEVRVLRAALARVALGIGTNPETV